MARTQIYRLKTPVTINEGTEDQPKNRQVDEVTFKFKLNYLKGLYIEAGKTVDGTQLMRIGVGDVIMVATKMVGETAEFLDELGDEDQAEILAVARDFFIGRLGGGSDK